MADDQQVNALSAAFPAPPPFYKHFTTDNLARIEQASAAVSGPADQSATAVDTKLREAADLPAQLRYLIPPALPTSEEYRSFGETFNLANPLPAPPPAPSTIPNLDLAALPTLPHADIQPTLLRLTRSILLAFLELAAVLASSPDCVAQKLSDIEMLFAAAHTLVNVYRPHQARETLIEMMEARVARGRREIEELRGMAGRVDSVLGGLSGADASADSSGEGGSTDLKAEGASVEDAERRRVDREQRLWTALDGIAMPSTG